MLRAPTIVSTDVLHHIASDLGYAHTIFAVFVLTNVKDDQGLRFRFKMMGSSPPPQLPNVEVRARVLALFSEKRGRKGARKWNRLRLRITENISSGQLFGIEGWCLAVWLISAFMLVAGSYRAELLGYLDPSLMSSCKIHQDALFSRRIQ